MFALLLACTPDATLIPTDASPAHFPVADGALPSDPIPGTDDNNTGEDPDTAPPIGDSGDADGWDGSGACPVLDAAVRVGHLPPGLEEVSGIVASRAHPGVVWVLEDSGNEPELYALDLDGTLLATVRLPVNNRDWEDLALVPCGEEDCLWIADTGDNDLVRDDAILHVIHEPAIADGDAHIDHSYPVHYADGARNVEAMVVSAAGVPTLFSKLDDGTTEVLQQVGTTFQVKARLDVHDRGDTGWDGRVTAADLWPDGHTLLLRTYAHAWRYELPTGDPAAVDGTTRVAMDAPDQDQVEAVAWDPTLGGWWQTSEGEGAELWYGGCAE